MFGLGKILPVVGGAFGFMLGGFGGGIKGAVLGNAIGNLFGGKKKQAVNLPTQEGCCIPSDYREVKREERYNLNIVNEYYYRN